MTFGKDFNAEQRAAFDAMSAERGSGMNASLLNQDRSVGNSDGQYYYNAIRDEAIKPNNVLNGYLGIQEIPNLMANGSSTRGSRGNINTNTNTNTLTDAEFTKGKNKFIDMMTPYSKTNMRNGFTYTADDDSGSFKISDIPPDMMSNGSNNGRGVDTSLSNTMGRDIASGMGDGLNNVMRMTENIQSKYGDPNDRTVDQIMSQYNVDNAENAFQGMDNNRTTLQNITDNFRQNEIDMKVMYDTNPDYQVSPSYGEAKGMNVNNFPGFGSTGLADIPVVGGVLDNAIGGVQTASMFGGDLLYQAIQAATDKNKSFSNVIPSAYEQAKGYAQARFDPRIDTSSAKSMFDAAQSLESQPKEVKEFNGLEDGSPSIFEGSEFATGQPKAKVKVKYNKNTSAPTVKAKPGGFAGAGASKTKPTRTTGSRGGRGNVGAKKASAKKSTPSKFSSGYSRRVGGR